MFNWEIINVKDILYIVKRKIHVDHNPIVNTWKEHLLCDTVFTKNGLYYFCQKIEEAQIIENEQ